MKRLRLILTLVSFSAVGQCSLEQLRYACPQLKHYTQVQVQELAKSYRGLPENVKSVISDYRLLRRQCEELEKL